MSELIACHHKVTLDIAKRDVCTIEVVNRDTANILEVNVCENGKEVSLENATLVTITYSNDTVDEMQISEDFKTAFIRINANCLKRGINFAKVCIYSGDNGLITAEMLTINCKQTVGSDNPAVPDPDMPKLKEMIEDAVAQAGGGAGLEPLIGTNKTLTPTQVREAFLQGRPIVFSFIDALGEVAVIFQSFEIYDDIIAASTILPLIDSQDMGVGVLTGDLLSNEWNLSETFINNPDDIQKAINAALAAAKASGEFDGADGITPTIGNNGNWYLGSTDTGKPSRGKDGKSAYSYAQDGGYTGTEVEFAAKLAAEGLDKALYVVNLTVDFDTMTPSADKTFEEIKQAHAEGKYNIVLSVMGLNVLPLYVISSDACMFVGVSTEHGDIAVAQVHTVIITKNNVINSFDDDLALKTDKLPNPYPLTFTGAVNETYDGSSAKTITIPSGGAHSDWNQNDSTAADYIKNRPFYTGDPVETVLVEESTVSFAELGNGLYMTEFESTFVPTVGEVYKISWDGTVYECTCIDFSGNTLIGNLSIAGAGSDTGEPFLMSVYDGRCITYTLDTSASHTFSISGRQAPIVKIPAKYINKDTSGYIVIHHNSIMTEEEARKYARDLNANEVRFIIWGNIYIIKLSFIGSARTLRLINLNGEEYSITKNDEGLYDYNDIKLSGSRFPYGFGSLTNPANINSDGTKIQISPKSFFEGMGTTDTLFYVLPNGTKAKPFEVLGNGMAVTPALILYSSTAGSTKKFKITVDDSGTIAATEVV